MVLVLTPGQVQDRLHSVHHDLTAAAQMLKKARDAEVAAEEAYRLARAKATLSDECPKVKRGENGVSVADRDAWVDLETQAERAKAQGAEAYRKAAEDHLRVVRDQASVVQSLAALMRAEMAMSGSVSA